MIQKIKYIVLLTLLISCEPKNEILELGQHYQKHQDYKSLQKIVFLLPVNSDTLYVKKILGEPNSMGFEYRYTVDSTGINGCTIGAVFQINKKGKITNKWINEICE